MELVARLTGKFGIFLAVETRGSTQQEQVVECRSFCLPYFTYQKEKVLLRLVVATNNRQVKRCLLSPAVCYIRYSLLLFHGTPL